MDIQDIKKDFVLRFGGNMDGIRSFCVGNPIKVLGIGLEKVENGRYEILLSIKTAISIRENEKYIFSYQLSDSNNEYSCDLDALENCNKKGQEKEIFETIKNYKGKIEGADILFSFDVNNDKFKKLKASLILGLEKLNNNFNKERICELSGRKNSLYNINEDDEMEYLPFNLNGYKVILALTDIKKEDISGKIKKAYANLKKENKNIKSVQDISELSPDRVDSDEKYLINELRRCELSKKMLKETGGYIKGIENLLKASYKELSSIMNKGKSIYENIYLSAEKTGYMEGIFILHEIGGAGVIVKNENVNDFMREFTKYHEERIGEKPEFYVCDSCDGGVEIQES